MHMNKKFIDRKFNFSDVSILPHQNIFQKKKKTINIKKTFKWKWSNKEWIGVPFVSSNNISVTNLKTHKILQSRDWLTIYPYYYTEYFLNNSSDHILKNTSSYGLSCGLTVKSQVNTSLLIDKMKDQNINVQWLCIENGIAATIEFYRNLYPDMIIIAGNIMTNKDCKYAINNGADIVKLGNYKFNEKSGVEYPQLSNIIDNYNTVKEMNGHIMSDSIFNISDCGKALAAGADMIMLDTLLSGHDESPGKLLWESSRQYKIESMRPIKFESPSINSEHFKVEYKGGLNDKLTEIESAITDLSEYINVDDISDIYHNSVFIPN